MTKDTTTTEKETNVDVDVSQEDNSKTVEIAPPVVVKVVTSEDAYQAYLREEISEDELRAVVAANGGNFYALKDRLERPDNAFRRQIPEDLYDDPSLAVSSVDDRLKDVEDRDKEVAKATKEAEKAEK